MSSRATLFASNSLRSPSISTPTEIPSEVDSNLLSLLEAAAFARSSNKSGCSLADPKPHSEACNI